MRSFKNGPNRCRIRGPNAALYLLQQKKIMRFCTFGQNPSGDFPQIFWMRAHPDPPTYIPSFIQIRSGLGEL